MARNGNLDFLQGMALESAKMAVSYVRETVGRADSSTAAENVPPPSNGTAVSSTNFRINCTYFVRKHTLSIS